MSANAPRVPHRFLVTLRLGEMPEDIPSVRACQRYGVPLAERIDGGPIDRLLRHHGSAARCARLHNAREPHTERPGVPGARRYDEIEQLTGVARVLRVEVADPAGVPALLQALSQVPRVESATPDLLCLAPFDHDASMSQGRASQVSAEAAWRAHQQIKLPQALAYEPGDEAVVIGVADTGVLGLHAELSQRLRRGFDTVSLDQSTVGDLVLVGDNSGRDEEPLDEVGHGTGCAGILRAQGIELPPGAAGLCLLTPVRVLGAALSGKHRVGVGALANIDAGMKRLIDLNVKVINMSFGTAEASLTAQMPRPHEAVLRYARARGVVLVAASGNSGAAESFYPAASEDVIAVGSVDADNVPSRFSTRGAHVALCAPGEKIWTCGMDQPGRGYQCANGTSFAAPFVTAVCALLISRAQRRAWPLSPATVKQILLDSVRPFGRAGVEGCGRGVVDALAALQRLDAYIDDALLADAGTDEGIAS
jgi:subtilisin family serine protease